jgi:hypothetical protein
MIDWTKPIEWADPHYAKECGPPTVLKLYPTTVTLEHELMGVLTAGTWALSTRIVRNVPEKPREVWVVYRDGKPCRAAETEAEARRLIAEWKAPHNIASITHLWGIIRMREAQS